MFIAIRTILFDQFNIERISVRPSTRLETLLDATNRNRFFRSIESTLAARLPRLKRSRWLQWSGDVFPPDFSTVSQLVEQCVNSNRITSQFGPEDHDAVFEIVVQSTSEVASVDKSKITAESNFVNDLGF